jgi:hypothetical protein
MIVFVPKDLATHFTQTLFAGDESDKAASDKFFVLSPDGNRAAVSLSELRPGKA